VKNTEVGFHGRVVPGHQSYAGGVERVQGVGREVLRRAQRHAEIYRDVAI
jgi:hypothetical protein